MDNPRFTYKVIGNGYMIYDNGQPTVNQDNYLPYPGATIEEAAQNHINEIIKYMEAENSPSPTEIEQLRTENAEVKLALAELAEAQEQERLNTQLALAELAESLMGGKA